MPSPEQSELIAALRALVVTICPSRTARSFQLDLRVDFYDNADPLRLCLPVPLAGCSPSAPMPATATAAKHGPDFRSVNWYGKDHTFTPTQAAIVRQLWQAWENGTPGVGQETLLESAGAESDRLANLFRDHLAWGTMIVSAGRGVYRLNTGSTPESAEAG